MAQIPEPQLPPNLAFLPDWIKDPPPWILKYFDKEMAYAAALVRVDMEKNICSAQLRALEQMQGILQKAQNK